MLGVLAVGDVIDDVIVRPRGAIAVDTDTPSTIEQAAGGSAANTACWLAAAGVPATFVGTVGTEDVARHAALLSSAGVVPRLAPSPLPTGAIVVVSQGEHRSMFTSRGANAATSPEQVTDELLAEHAVLHLTGHVLEDRAGEPSRDDAWRRLLDRARAAGALVSVAPGSAALLASFGRERFLEVVGRADVLCAGLDEARLLTGIDAAPSAAAALAQQHALVVVTLGAGGAIVARGDGVQDVTPAPATAVDVTGAGDAFVAGLLAGVLDGASDLAAAQRGAALAARAVGTVGARP